MKILPYKQTLTHSCLAASFLMLLQEAKDLKFSKKDEQEITLKGSQRTYPFYIVGITAEIAKKYKNRINIIADNKYFAGTLKKSFKNKKIAVTYQPITVKLISEMVKQLSVICHVDIHGLGDYSHSSHFLVIEKAIGNAFIIIDPWNGKRSKISARKLETAISELKKEVKMCPLLFSIG